MYWIILCACAVAYAQDSPPVNTTHGSVVGRQVDGYLVFHGIPYAGSTSGENRFKAPTPAHNFPGVFHAVESNVLCAHPSPRGLIGVEDCLRLSIHTKNLTTPKPVLVYIQGEDFETWNTGSYSYKKLVDSELVVVTLNYRLSIFGFLCLGVTDAPGNAGLRDIVQGLKWIQENIAGFGGDPNNVVLLGHGSGAVLADLVTFSPLADGLVHKVIALSGSSLAPSAISYDPVGHAKAVGDKLGYQGKNREELAKLLSTTELNVLESALHDFEFPNNTVLFGPCIENVALNPNDTFLADAPLNILRSGNYSHVPYIAGNTNREGTIRAEQAAFRNWLERMQANLTDFTPLDLNFEGNTTDVVNSIRDFYFGQKDISMETIEDFLDYVGDTSILIPVLRNVKERALTSTSEVRLFEFAYRGTLNTDWPYTQIPVSGAKHGSLLNYIFDFDLKVIDRDASDGVIKRIATFAHTGDPNPKNESITTWLPLQRGISHVLYFSGEQVKPEVAIYKEEMRGNVNKQELDFWDPLYEKYYVPPKTWSSAGRLVYFFTMLLFTQVMLRFF